MALSTKSKQTNRQSAPIITLDKHANMIERHSIELIKKYLDHLDETPKSAVDRIYADLYRRITNLELPPGVPLTRVDLCKEYNVSQTPVREALLRLEQVGLIKVRPQSGTEVSYIDIQQLEQNHFLREALEFEVVRCLSLHQDSRLLSHLTMLVDMQESLIGGNAEDINLFSKLDRLFHSSMFDAVGQSQLYELICSRSGHMDRIRRLHLPSEGKVRGVILSHRKIIQSIASGDPIQAVDSMREHLSGTLSKVEEIKKTYPEFFL
ncbi:GntR family transcriptional regulator [Marinomonas spartinae]|uniref:GntR family transcriptional regulator n=1 Tax=Marinomonas spartinae TaxID=1792290 RepID=UPI001F21FE68|nr:GntR family transcriptional regulator [Marinomonas spartinae]